MTCLLSFVSLGIFMLRTASCVASMPSAPVARRAAQTIAGTSASLISVTSSSLTSLSTSGSMRLAKPKSRSLHMSTSHFAPLSNVMSHVRSPHAFRRRPFAAPIFSKSSSKMMLRRAFDAQCPFTSIFSCWPLEPFTYSVTVASPSSRSESPPLAVLIDLCFEPVIFAVAKIAGA